MKKAGKEGAEQARMYLGGWEQGTGPPVCANAVWHQECAHSSVMPGRSPSLLKRCLCERGLAILTLQAWASSGCP